MRLKINIDNNMYKLKNKRDTMLIQDNKINHRISCFQKLKFMNTLKLKEFGKDINKEAVLIEFRDLSHLEFLVKNTINLLDNNWNHTIVCGVMNFNFITKICNNICKNLNSKIRIIKMNYNNINVHKYNEILYDVEFWDMFKGEKILLYQEDSIMFHGRIDKFLKYDYVGAPWPIATNQYKGGNGGFSLRTKSKIIECLNKQGKESIPEDIYFSNYMENVCPRDLSKEFSQEFVYGINPLGGHCHWRAYTND